MTLQHSPDVGDQARAGGVSTLVSVRFNGSARDAAEDGAEESREQCLLPYRVSRVTGEQDQAREGQHQKRSPKKQIRKFHVCLRWCCDSVQRPQRGRSTQSVAIKPGTSHERLMPGRCIA